MIHTEDKIKLRPADEEECRLGGFASGEDALAYSINNSSFAYAISRDGGPILAYWGWRDDSFVTGGCKAWMLSTPAIEGERRWAARQSRKLLDFLLSTHYAIEVIVDPSYDVSVRWLEWLGFRRDGFYDRFIKMRITRGGRA